MTNKRETVQAAILRSANGTLKAHKVGCRHTGKAIQVAEVSAYLDTLLYAPASEVADCLSGAAWDTLNALPSEVRGEVLERAKG